MEDAMRIRFGNEPGIKSNINFADDTPAVIYPRMYCPRCGSLNIHLRQISESEPIWECWECAANFKLQFPLTRRF